MIVGLWGLEHPHALAYLRTLLNLEQVEGVVVWEELPTPPAWRGLAPRGIARADEPLASSLRRGRISLLVVCASASVAPQLCATALTAGIPVLAEKPVARDPTRLRRLVALSDRTGVQLGVSYVSRHQQHIVDTKRLVASGSLGPLEFAELRLFAGQIRHRDPSHWLFRRADAGGGVLTWLGCHALDLIEYVTDDCIESIAAQVATVGGSRVDVEDAVTVSMRLSSGALASLQAGYLLSRVEPGYLSRNAYDVSGSFFCQAGLVSWRSSGIPRSLRVETLSDRPIRVRYPADNVRGYAGRAGRSFIRACLRAASDASPMPATGKDALRVATLVAAAYRSARTGRHVRLEPTTT